MSEIEAPVVTPAKVGEDKPCDDPTPVVTEDPTCSTIAEKPPVNNDALPATENTELKTDNVKIDIKDAESVTKNTTPATEDVKLVITDSPLETKEDKESTNSQKQTEPPGQKEEAMETSESAESSSEPTALDAKIIRQIEYYFGDHNLARDRFIKDEMKKDDGWLPMETMVKFQRLSNLTTDYTVICNALRKSKSGLMEVSKDNEKIRRIPERELPDFTKERRDEMNSRSVYTKGFPLTTSLDDLLEFFSKFGPTETLFMRRQQNRSFKGSAFVMFDRKEDAENFVKAESIKYKESELKRLMKSDYFQQKESGNKQKKDEKFKKDEINHQKRIEKVKAKLSNTITKGAVIYMKGFTGDTTMREHIHNVFSDFATIVWIDFARGQTEGWIRFDGEDTAKPALEKAVEATDGKLMVNDQEIQTSVLEGEEEQEYWQKVFNDQAERRARKQNKFRGHGGKGGYRHDRQRGKKRRGDGDGAHAQDDDDDNGDVGDDNDRADEGAEGEPPSKIKKSEKNESEKKEVEMKEVQKKATEVKESEVTKTEAIKTD